MLNTPKKLSSFKTHKLSITNIEMFFRLKHIPKYKGINSLNLSSLYNSELLNNPQRILLK